MLLGFKVNAALVRATNVAATSVSKVTAGTAVEQPALPDTSDSATVLFGNWLLLPAGINDNGSCTIADSIVARTVDRPVMIMRHRDVAHQHKVAEVACYRLERTLMGCADPPILGGRGEPSLMFARVDQKQSRWGHWPSAAKVIPAPPFSTSIEPVRPHAKVPETVRT